jgi:hypothetical protein
MSKMIEVVAERDVFKKYADKDTFRLIYGHEKGDKPEHPGRPL